EILLGVHRIVGRMGAIGDAVPTVDLFLHLVGGIDAGHLVGGHHALAENDRCNDGADREDDAGRQGARTPRTRCHAHGCHSSGGYDGISTPPCDSTVSFLPSFAHGDGRGLSRVITTCGTSPHPLPRGEAREARHGPGSPAPLRTSRGR